MKFFQTLLGASLVIALLAGCVPITLPAAGEPETTNGRRISGRVLWGSTPVPAAQVELRTGAWATAAAGVVTRTSADTNGYFVLPSPPVGEFGLVAGWPDGGTNRAAVTPVQITAGAEVTGVVVYLVRELELVEPLSGATVPGTPTLRWQPFPGTAHYRVWVIDAGTTALMVEQIVTTTSLTVPRRLAEERTYTWLVQALAADGSLLAELENTFHTQGN
jgi:hypothetical protein